MPGLTQGRTRRSSRRKGWKPSGSVRKRAGKAGVASTSGISQGSDELARKPSVSSMTGVMWWTAMRTASRAMAKQSDGVAAARTTIGVSPLRPMTAW